MDTHKTWHKLYNFLSKKYGKDLYSEPKFMGELKYRDFNELELSRRLVGYEVIVSIERWVKRHAPEIEVVRCDDHMFSGSILLLVPHPAMGITVVFIPQLSGIQNMFFLYERHYEKLLKCLNKMKKVWAKTDGTAKH